MATHFAETELWRQAMTSAGMVWRLSDAFPPGEREGLTEPLRLSAREVAAEIARAWRGRCDSLRAFRSLCLAETMAEETCVWLRVAERCGYLEPGAARGLQAAYARVRALLRRRMRRSVSVGV